MLFAKCANVFSCRAVPSRAGGAVPGVPCRAGHAETPSMPVVMAAVINHALKKVWCFAMERVPCHSKLSLGACSQCAACKDGGKD